MPFAHNVYRLFFIFFYCVIDLFIVYSMCNSVLLSVHTAKIHLGQVAVVNENLFSTSLPGPLMDRGDASVSTGQLPGEMQSARFK